MIFTRTPSGLKNFGRFFGANLTIYVEGRVECEESVEDPSRADSKFYSALCSVFLKGKKIKIKLTGNKKNALGYHERILAQNIPNSLVIVDRDYDGVLFYRQQAPCLILTHGYSWENDFWTEELIQKTLETATAVNRDERNSEKLNRMGVRLAKLSSINAAAHCNGKSLFESKGNSKGINIDPSRYFPVSKNEFSRLSRKFLVNPVCNVMIQVYETTKRLPPKNVIQGHLWEHASLLLISHVYAKSTSTTLKNNQILVNIALSTFANDPASYLTSEAFDYYDREFSRAM
ncbi:DUF4435 domain-containing protein [Pseudomonas sp. S8]|uniref:hypothetical protein n=1 Tax=Pseudomonas sp. S8 TaxID=211136 RepID=UPI003D2C2157